MTSSYSVDSAPVAARPEVRAGLPRTLEWLGGDDGFLRLLDQTRLPHEVVFVDCRDAETVWEAIKVLRVRGAPAIGVAAAYGLALGVRPYRDAGTDEFLAQVRRVAEYLRGARPTAVNLAWAVNRTERVAISHVVGAGGTVPAGRPAAVGRSPQAVSARSAWDALLSEAHAIAREDAEVCRRIGEAGAGLIPAGGGVLTHCNAGALATVAWGTALSLMYVAHEQGRRFRVFADETRPLLQGARLTAFELAAAGIDVSVLCDGSAASLMQAGLIQMVVVGADRIAANGDTANKIGTYGLAVAAKHHNIPFYVAAPLSTFDLTIGSGADIPIEQRSEDEVRSGLGRDVVASGVRCLNPAFDVTPGSLIRGIVTQFGVLEPVTAENVAHFFQQRACIGR